MRKMGATPGLCLISELLKCSHLHKVVHGTIICKQQFSSYPFPELVSPYKKSVNTEILWIVSHPRKTRKLHASKICNIYMQVHLKKIKNFKLE